MFKAKLHEMCQRRRWSLPKYSATSDGPPHMPNFKASVFVNGFTFSSYHTFHSSKEAYNQAAMNAFLNFSSPSGTLLLFLRVITLYWEMFLEFINCFPFYYCALKWLKDKQNNVMIGINKLHQIHWFSWYL